VAQIVWTAEAQRWLQEIYDYIAEDSPSQTLRRITSSRRSVEADVRPRNHRVRGLILFGAAVTFNRTVVLRYRIHLEQRHYAPATIQPEARGGPTGGLRVGGRHNSSQSGAGGEHSPREGRAASRGAVGNWLTA
jgi:plasmid stabilization system protein ParE